MYPFRLCGQSIQLLRYKVTYTNSVPDKDGKMVNKECVDYCATLDEANEIAEGYINATVEKTDTSVHEWLDGIQVPDVSDTFAEAVKIYEMGKEAYEKKLATNTAENNIQLRADIDFLAAMQGVIL